MTPLNPGVDRFAQPLALQTGFKKGKTMLKKLSLALIILLVGAAYAQTTVVWWDLLSGGDGVRMQKLIDDFNASHDVQIDRTTLEWGTPFYTKVQTAAAVGEGPDIVTYHVSRYPLAVSQNGLRAISQEELSSVGLSVDDYNPGLIKAMTIDGELYGVPLDYHAIVLYYNKDVLGPLGLLGDNGQPNFTDSLESFNAALETLKTESDTLPLSVSSDDGMVWRVFYSLLNQQDGAAFMTDGEITMGEAGRVALQTMRDWMANGYVPENAEYPASVALFTSGDAAMMINGVWEVPTMVDLAANGQLFDWGAVRLPVLFDHPATWADSTSFAIPNNANQPMSEEKLQAVLEVIAWMNKNSLFWATAGHIPAYNAVTESTEYKAMEPNATYAVLGETAVFEPQSVFTGVASPTFDAVGNYLVPAFNGQLPVDQALEMMTQDLDSQMR